MLLSRLTCVQPSGAVIVPLPDMRAVTTATITSPAIATGRAIVSEVAFEVRAVVLPLRMIEPSGAEGMAPGSSRSTLLPAGEANAPASALAPSRAMQAKAIKRGRLPNMPG
jgi:hypothetical protein